MVLGLNMNSRNNYDKDQKDRSCSSVLLFLDESLDDDDSSACVCWLLFLSKSLIHRIFWEFVRVQMKNIFLSCFHVLGVFLCAVCCCT